MAIKLIGVPLGAECNKSRERTEIVDMMIRLEEDENFYLLQHEYGLHHAILFSWKETSIKLLDLYKQCVKS